MIALDLAGEVLKIALAKGADFAELYIEDGTVNTISVENERLESASTKRKCGAGVRVFSGVLTAYVYTSSFDEFALKKIAAQAAEALAVQTSKRYEAKLQPWHRVCSYQNYDLPYGDIDINEKIAILKNSAKAAKSTSELISQVSTGYIDMDRKVAIYNSEGVVAEDRRCRGRFTISAVASDAGKMFSAGNNPGAGQDFTFFRNLDWENEAKAAAKMAVTMLNAPECPAITAPVVIENGFGGVIFHEACGHSLEAASVAYNNSEFAGKLGQQIAAKCVSAVDDGTIAGAWGSAQVDDEGHPTQRNVLIENGICKSYLVDRLGGRLMNCPSTGSGRRQDYTFASTSRMTNTFILNGNDDVDEMIADIPDGLYAKSMGGGSVNPITGEFNFAVREGYWIRNGKILTPVRGATLIGKGADVLMKIDRVGNNLKQAQGMCGASSGSIPTNVGQPRLRVSEIVIGGSGGKL